MGGARGVGGGTCARGVRWGVYVSHRARARGREGTSGDAQTGDGWMDGVDGCDPRPRRGRARGREEEDCFVLTF